MLRIALADDQALIRHGLKALLESLGGIQVVVEADNGDSLLDALASHEVDAVLADIRMPRRSGIGALKALRQRGNLVPVILLINPVKLQKLIVILCKSILGGIVQSLPYGASQQRVIRFKPFITSQFWNRIRVNHK